MSDEFDDAVDPIAKSAAAGVASAGNEGRAARLMARLYASANLALRTRLVACLLRPLGSLGVAAVAAGAFTVVLSRRGAGGLGVAMADVAEFSKEQDSVAARIIPTARNNPVRNLYRDNGFAPEADGVWRRRLK